MAEIKLTSEITVRLVQSMGGDHMVVAAARVSTSGEEALKYARMTCGIHTPLMPEHETCDHCIPYRKQAEDNYGLIKYLMKHRHGTPFEHNSMVFFVHAPIFVWREWHRHRIGHSYNEESGRYKQLEPVFYIPPRDRPMMKVDNWKPGRPKFLSLAEWAETTADPVLVANLGGQEPLIDEVYTNLYENLNHSYEASYAAYENNLSSGIDPGLARDCLPVGIYSSCWVTVNARSLMAFLSLRTHDPGAMFPSYPLYEIEVAARKVEDIFARLFPLTYRAFNECGRVGP